MTTAPNLLETSDMDEEGPDAIQPALPEDGFGGRLSAEEQIAANAPDYLPPKFWDVEAGEVRVEELARSYAELERRLGSAEGNIVPEDPAAYRIDAAMEGLESDPDVNQRLMEAGFTQEQAQLVYDLAAEKLAPFMSDLAAEAVTLNEKRRLAQHFGGEEKWETLSGQMENWAKANLPENVASALSNSYDGILTLHRMMTDGEPEMVSGAAAPSRGRSEEALRKMMDDPRYWRDHDQAFAAEVRQGFEDLYPGEG